MNIIEVHGLTKVFGKQATRALTLLAKGKSRDAIHKETGQLVAVNQVNFSVRQGEVVVIIGLSGSGKSTLLRCLNRLVEPSAGSVHVDGTDITRLSRKDLRSFRQRRFSMVFQHFALFPHFSVLRNVAYGLELMKVPAREREEKALKALESVNLVNWAGAMPRQLSGGMKQRVGLARALALDPEILLMDEAFSALDPLTRHEMQGELLRLQHALHKTIVFITHDLDEALSLGDKIILLHDGEIVQEGTPEDILSFPANDYVASFVSHVDRSRVLTASSILAPVRSTVIPGIDGPLTALRKMRHHDMTNIFAIDEHHRLLGLISEEDALALQQRGERNLLAILQREIPSAKMDDTLSSITRVMASLPHPLPVLDEAGILRGIIIRGGLLEALSSETVVED